MREKIVFLICLVSVLGFVFFTRYYIDKSDLVGEMILSNGLSLYSDLSDSCLIRYTPTKGEFEKFEPGIFIDLSYSNDKAKILCEKYDETDNNYALYEYDTSSNAMTVVVNENLLIQGESSCFRYIPNSNNISYIADDKIYAYDRVTGANTCIVEYECFYSYSWDNKGQKIVYADYSGNIYIYDMLTKKNNQILKGSGPVFSNNGEYIAYCDKNRKVSVYDLKTKEEWKSISTGGVQQFVFSPDDKYLAAEIQYMDITNNPYFKMYVIDFKNGKHIRLFKGDDGIPAFDWK